MVNDNKQKDYKFEEIKEIFNKYELIRDSEGNFVVNKKESNKIVEDDEIMDKIKFSITWVNSFKPNDKEKKVLVDDLYHNAFSEYSKKMYNCIMMSIENQLLKDGNINPLQVVTDVEGFYYKDINNIIKNIFSEPQYATSVDNWARQVIKKALPKTIRTFTYDEAVCVYGENPLLNRQK